MQNVPFSGPEYPVGILVTRNNDVYTIRDRAGALLLGVELEKIKTNEPVRIDLLCGKKIIGEMEGNSQ